MPTDQSRAVDLSAFQAFRADLGRDNSESHALDGVGIEVLSLLNCAFAARELPDEATRLRDAALSAARSFFADSAERRCSYDDHPATSDVDIIRLLVERLEAEGRHRVARGLLDATTWLAEGDLDAGRLLVDKAKNARRQGNLDLAKAQFESVLRIGRSSKLPEIQARAYLGLAGCAQSRGNFEELRRLLPLGLKASVRARARRLELQAHVGIGMAAAMASDYSKAVTHLWEAYQIAGSYRMPDYEAGCNLAQVLLSSGRNSEARYLANSMFRTTLPVRVALPLLGGFAVASARLGLRDDVDWACRQVESVRAASKYPREFAVTLAECAAALDGVGETHRGDAMHRRAEALAIKHGFNDLTFREAIASARAPVPVVRPLTGAAARAAQAVTQLEPEHPLEVAVTV